MASVYHVDYENGNDGNDGSDWAHAWKTISATGASAARIAPGDTIKIAKSPAPSSLGCTGKWTKYPTAFPVAVAITSSTNASPIVITKTGHGFLTGDIIFVTGHTTNLTANGTWTITKVDDNNFSLDGSVGIGAGGATGYCYKTDWLNVGLSSACVKTITRCEQAWTASGGATITRETSQVKEGNGSLKLVKASPANNTLYAYFTIDSGSGIDFSAYQKISFFMRNDTAITADRWKVCLCSDTVGATPVDTFIIPAVPSIQRWLPITITGDNANLGSAIKSIAIYSGSSAASITALYFDNFIACTTNGLNLQSLISKNTLEQSTISATGYGNEAWWSIAGISEDGKICNLDAFGAQKLYNTGYNANGYGYTGITETVTTYKRETIKAAIASAATTVFFEMQKAGTSENYIAYEAGYDTGTNTQTGETFLDGLNGYGYIIKCGYDYNSFNRFSWCRSYSPYFAGRYNLFSFISDANNCSGGGFYFYGGGASIITVLLNSIGNYYGLQTYNSNQNKIISMYNITSVNAGLHFTGQFNGIINSIYNIANTPTAIYTTNQMGGIIEKIISIDFCQYIFTVSGFLIIRDMTTSNTRSGLIYFYAGEFYINKWVSTDICTVFISTNSIPTSGFVTINSFNGTPIKYWDFANAVHQDATAGGTGKEWVLSVTNAYQNISSPARFKLAKIATIKNKLVTVQLYVKKSDTTIGGKIVTLMGDGISSDIETVVTDDTNRNLITHTFTPTETGVADIEFWAYWISGVANQNIIIDGIDVSAVDSSPDFNSFDITHCGEPIVLNAGSGGVTTAVGIIAS